MTLSIHCTRCHSIQKEIQNGHSLLSLTVRTLSDKQTWIEQESITVLCAECTNQLQDFLCGAKTTYADPKEVDAALQKARADWRETLDILKEK